MKKTLFFLLIITLCICLFSGCAEKMLLTVDESVKSVVVTSLPEGYEYSFGGEDEIEVLAVSSGDGRRIWDSHHPDDSERYRYFSVTLPALDNAKIEYSSDDYKIYGDGEYLLGGPGHGCESFYLYDFTGDGCPELCFGMNFGSGIVDKRVEIIDYTTKTCIFSLCGRMSRDYYLFMRDGFLCVRETEYMKFEPTRTGVLTFDGSEITVVWDSEVDARVDRDDPPQPGDTVH